MINVLHLVGKALSAVLAVVFLAVTCTVAMASHQITGLSKTNFSSNSSDLFYIQVSGYGNILCADIQAACVVSETSSAASITPNANGGWNIQTAAITGTQTVSVMVQVTVQSHTHQSFINIYVVGPPPPTPAVDDIRVGYISGARFIDGAQRAYANKGDQLQFELQISREGSSGFTETVAPTNGWSISPSNSGATISTSGLLTLSSTLSTNRQFTISGSFDSFTASRTIRARAKFPNGMTVLRDGIETTTSDVPVFDEGLSPAATYTARLNYDDETRSTITPIWGTSNTTLATINSSGQLYTLDVSANILTSLSAIYYISGLTYYPELSGAYGFNQSFNIENKMSLDVAGSTVVDENNLSGYQYTAIVTLPGSAGTSLVNPEWRVTDLSGLPTSHAQIDELGVLTTNMVDQDEQVIVKAELSYLGITTNAQKTVDISNSYRSLESISINGPSLLNNESVASYTVTATYDNGSVDVIGGNAITWSVSGSDSISIDIDGNVSIDSVDSNQTASIHASFASDGISRNAEITIVLYEASSFLGKATIEPMGMLGNFLEDRLLRRYEISDDANVVVFESQDDHLVDPSLYHHRGPRPIMNVYVYDRTTKQLEVLTAYDQVSPPVPRLIMGGGAWARISGNGNFVAFTALEGRLDSISGSDLNNLEDVYLHDRSTGVTKRISNNSLGNAGNNRSHSESGYVTNDGDVIYSSTATDIGASSDSVISTSPDVFLYDHSTGKNTCISCDGLGSLGSGSLVGVGLDGRLIAFISKLTFSIDGTDPDIKTYNIFLYDRYDESLKLITSNAQGRQGNRHSSSYYPAIEANTMKGAVEFSSDGNLLVFTSYASDLVENGIETDFGGIDVFIHDLSSGVTKRISNSFNGGSSFSPKISADGNVVVFTSTSTDLVEDVVYNDSRYRLYLHDLASGVTEQVSNDKNYGNNYGYSYSAVIKDDGNVVIYGSLDSGQASGADNNGRRDIFKYDRRTKITERVSNNGAGQAGNHESFVHSVSLNGDVIVYLSSATDIADPEISYNYEINTSYPPRQIVFSDSSKATLSSAAISLVSPSDVVSLNDDIKIDVNIDTNTLSALGGGLNIFYDSTLLDFISFTSNPSLDLDVAFRREPDTATEGVTLNGLAFGEFEGLSGSLLIGTLTFHSLNVGIADLTLSDNSLTGPMGAFYMVDGSELGGINYTGTSITITDNEAPVASNLSIITDAGIAQSSNMLATDSDVGDQLIYQIAGMPGKGDVVIDNPTTGAFTYTAYIGQAGADSFTYQASDGKQVSLPATVSITINENINVAPVASGSDISTDEDVVFTSGTLVASDADSPVLTYRIDTNGLMGTAEIIDANTGAFHYTPTANANGSDSFTFIANDGVQDSNIATMTVTINPVNDAPVSGNNSFSTIEDQPVSGTLAMTDVDGDALTYSIVSNGSLGTVNITNATTGAFTYTPNANANGEESFTFIANDSSVNSATTTATISVSVDNDVPLALAGNITTTEDAAVNGQLSASDIDGDALTFSIATNGSLGVATITNAATGAYTYTPNTGMAGTDSFGFYVNDGALNSNVATVTVTINALPTAGASSVYTYAWSNPIGGAGKDYAQGVSTDAAGNVYVVGHFESSVDFDRGTGVDTHTSAGLSDVYVTKLNADGSYGWTRTFGGTGKDLGMAIAVDDLGNSYVTGGYSASVDFDPGVDVDSRTAVDRMDIFVTKLDADGSYGWTRTFGGAQSGSTLDYYGNGIALDNAASVVITGFYWGSVDFDMNGTGDIHASVGSSDIFLTKLGTDGSYGWTHSLGNTEYDEGNGVAIDASNNIYLTGAVTRTIDFDPGVGIAQHVLPLWGRNVFIAQYLPDGSYGWSQAISGGVGVSHSVAVGENGVLYIAGEFSDTLDFDPGVGVDSHSTGSQYTTGAFVSKYGTDGSYDWTKTYMNTYGVVAYSVAVGALGDVFVGGKFNQTVDFDPGVGEDIQNGGISFGSFITHLKSDGSYGGWTQTLGYDGNSGRPDAVHGFAIDPAGAVIEVGKVYGWAIDFDPGVGVDSHTTLSTTDGFIRKWNYSLNGDSDGDGYLDTNDAFPFDPAEWLDSDGDLMGNNADLDDDNDGMPDDYELTYGLDPLVDDAALDLDGDGLTNLDEYQQGTDPTVPDGAVSSYSYGWSNPIGGAGKDYAQGVSTDAAGNVYVVGHFESSVDFDRGTGVDTHTSAGLSDVYVTKLNADGSYGWTRTFGGTGKDLGMAIAVDDLGNSYVTGGYSASVDFDPGVDVDSRTAVDRMDIFVTKLDADGSYGWTRTFGGAQSGSTLDYYGNGIALDNAASVVITGFYWGSVDFDMNGTGDIHASVGSSDIFLTKLGTDGSYGWTHSLGNTEYDEGNGVAIDASNNIYLTGAVTRTIDFDPGVGIAQHVLPLWGRNVFIAQYLPDGSYGWSQAISGGVGVSHSVAVGENGVLYIAGEFSDTLDFDPGVGVDSHSTGSQYTTGAFVSKYGTDGSYDWTKTYMNTYGVVAYSVAVGALGDVFVGGKFNQTVDFDPGVGEDIQNGGISFGSFITHLKSDGSYGGWTQTLKYWGGNDAVHGFAIDPFGAVIEVGEVNGWAIDFDPGAGVDSYTSSNTDGFIRKWNYSLVPQ